MKITAIHLYAIRLPLRDPFVISYGSYSDMPSIIVKMETDEGIIGYGEGVADDHVTGESWESTFHTFKAYTSSCSYREKSNVYRENTRYDGQYNLRCSYCKSCD